MEVAFKLFMALVIIGIISLITVPISFAAINHLFGTSIQFTFWNWVAGWWLTAVVASTTRTSSSK